MLDAVILFDIYACKNSTLGFAELQLHGFEEEEEAVVVSDEVRPV